MIEKQISYSRTVGIIGISLFIAVLYFFILNTHGLAQSNNGANTTEGRVYSVYGIELDQASSSAERAKSLALQNAEFKAFWLLIRKLADEDYLLYLPQLSHGEIRQFVQSLDIYDERFSTRRYLAQVNVGFNPVLIRQFLSQHSVPYSEVSGGPIVILPIFMESTRTKIFESPNPIRDAMADMNLRNHLTVFQLSEGNFKDRLVVGNENFFMNSFDRTDARWNDFLERYRASDVLLIQGQFAKKKSDQDAFHFSYRLGLYEDWAGGVLKAYPDESQSDLMKRAVQIILDRIDQNWQEITAVRINQSNHLDVRLLAQTVQEWSMIMNRLRDVPIIENIDITSMAVPETLLSIDYSGAEEQLKLILSGVNLTLTQDAKGWRIEPLESSQGAAIN